MKKFVDLIRNAYYNKSIERGMEMLEKIIASIITLITARQLWHSGTKAKYESEIKKLELQKKRRGG